MKNKSAFFHIVTMIIIPCWMLLFMELGNKLFPGSEMMSFVTAVCGLSTGLFFTLCLEYYVKKLRNMTDKDPKNKNKNFCK